MSDQINQRDSFIFYRSFYESVKKLSKEDKAEIFEAICAYSLDEKVIELSLIPDAIFTVIKPQLDANRKRFENGIKGGEHGKKGGRPKKKTPRKPQENPDGDFFKNPKKTPNVNVNVNDNVNDNVNLNQNENSESESESESEFENFWQSYKPIHTSKGNKEKSKQLFLKAIKNHPLDSITQGLSRYMSHCHSKNSYTKSVEVWLRNEGWNDEYQEAPKLTETAFEDKFSQFKHLLKNGK